ncbi:MAG: RNA polymerase sigma factor [Rhodospirillales bacterium]|nr:RNA polymerase sigma factor [Rhodospirillales bacterium]
MSLPPEREKDLIQRAQKGDAYAFETLLGDYYMTIYKMAYGWIRQKEAAEDITQNVYLKLARTLDSFRFDSAFTSWLYRLVINTAKDWQKSQSRHTSESGMIDLPTGTATNEETHYAQQVMEQIERLPLKERDALILVAIEGMSHATAADHLGCSEGTISWRVHEARKKLKETLGEAL